MTTTTLPPSRGSSTKISAASLASHTRSDRNRAVDLYRVVAMVAVAIGHWLALVAVTGPDGELVTGNALEFVPSMAWVTWLLQVMPLFFVVGGFSSALSLDSHRARGGRPQDWVAARMRRMLAPAVVLAGVWLAILVAGTLVGVGALVGAGAIAAAIPLWFLANYTIDTALAPYLLPRFRHHPARLAVSLLGAFALFEALRFAGVPVLPHVNWVIGWLLFQVAGFAWCDGLLPAGRRLAAVGVALWGAAAAAVAFGPWPVAMVHHPGLENSPTHPPSLALLLFGAAFSTTALVFAPTVTAWLARSPKAWTAVVAANSAAMSIYLWHMTAAVAATAVFHALGLVPSVTVGSADWWLAKGPMIGLSMLILAPIVAVVAKVERRALLAPRQPWPGGAASMMVVAAVISIAVKLWSGGGVVRVAIGTTVLLIVWFGWLRTPTQNETGDRELVETTT
ncbi:MAG: acyltransferase [Actinomycetia bacterium]|nr:acyltransferase [Actinomycetes bacterium]